MLCLDLWKARQDAFKLLMLIKDIAGVCSGYARVAAGGTAALVKMICVGAGAAVVENSPKKKT